MIHVSMDLSMIQAHVAVNVLIRLAVHQTITLTTTNVSASATGNVTLLTSWILLNVNVSVTGSVMLVTSLLPLVNVSL